MTTGHAEFDRFIDGFGELVTGGAILPAWSPDGKALAFLDGTPENRTGRLVDLESGENRPLFADVAVLRDAVRAATGQTPPGRGVPFEHIGFAGPRTLVAVVGTARLTVDLDSGEVVKLPAESPDDVHFGHADSVRRDPQKFLRTMPLTDPTPARELVSPDGSVFASTVDGNVVLRAVADNRTVPLTTDGTPEHEYRFDLVDPMLAMLGLGFPVCNWSPDGSRFAVHRVDNRGVHQSPQVHNLKREDEVVNRYHAQAGGRLERTTLHVLDVYGHDPVQLDLGDTTDIYPVHAAWLPDGAQLVVFLMSRDCRRAEVLLADAVTGATRSLFTEESETFVRIHHDVYFGKKIGLFLTPDGTRLLWLSERSGWKQLYLYDLDGTLIRQLTDGEWPVDYVHRVDGEYAYFTAHLDQDRPYDVHLARVPLAGGPVEQLSEQPGVHSAMFAPHGEVFVDTWSTPAEAPRSVLRRSDGSLVCELSAADTSRLNWVPPREFTAIAADGETELWGTLFFPVDFDETKQYPLIEHVYGGPQIAVAPHSFQGMFTTTAQALAQLGYVTFVVDGRGTPERSKAFHDVVYRDWAGGLVPDHAAVVEQLKARYAFLSEAKVGVTGHSWGGYSAFRLAAERPDVYTAAISSAPGFDPYSSVLYECYLGFPQTDAEAYREAALYPLADQLSAEFLIACGTIDHATWTDSVKMVDALIRAGKKHEFVLLSGQPHGYTSVHNSYFWRKAADFFRTHLTKENQ
ncbi:S9 family peptidase [Amycolatopsis jiangsuensis]|uniref:Dipeptidyl aminopeptidase/acylaminoacyl peptidase n=1 Tax=Amycolatopsis jiangsuensis TaxID=1181879 RepID=A0A840J5P6_9PSEU|nr:DPP IV N-terminal domain-containing protein [Amycolatopsis jiangsuensis]MBB4688728.1 dipeptidyl aminopeptidase/acylaminoacyl peptidase [Amycolatopsis jiangsuensis]